MRYLSKVLVKSKVESLKEAEIKTFSCSRAFKHKILYKINELIRTFNLKCLINKDKVAVHNCSRKKHQIKDTLVPELIEALRTSLESKIVLESIYLSLKKYEILRIVQANSENLVHS